MMLAVVASAALACHRGAPAGDGDAFVLPGPVAASGQGLANALFQTVGAHLQGGHTVELLDNGHVFDSLVEAIGKARKSVHIDMYIWETGIANDRVSAALIERARAGVACRIVYDAFGSSKFATTVQPALEQAGCQLRPFRPATEKTPLARNHRKLAIIDGTVAFTGGFGIRDEWLGDGVTGEHWRDENVRFTGPAVLDAQQAFAENWQETGGALLPADAFPEADASAAPAGTVRVALVASTASPVITRAERLTQLVIVAAKHRLWIANAYFVPSAAILDLVKGQAKAGVDVRLLVPGLKSDSKLSLAAQHALYPGLLAVGIRVWEYEPSMMHSKTMIADDQLSVIGSINFDPLSLNKLEEAALVVEDRATVDQLAKTFEQDCTHAKERQAGQP